MVCHFLKNTVAYSLIFILLPFSFLSAQSFNDTVHLGGGDSLQCFYRLQNGQKTYRQLNEWDLAFQTQGITFGILINEAIGEKLYVYPKADSTAWNSIDTTGMFQWPTLHNSLTTWNMGAFNQNSPFAYDVGWGVYTGPPDHFVIGDSINLVVMPDGQVKKVLIRSLKNKVYVFKYANLDGTDEKLDSLSKQDFDNKSTGYYSFAQHATVNREPNLSNWDLLFTKQLTAPDNATSLAEIPFGSVYLNHMTAVAKVTGPDASIFNPPLGLIVDSSITAIGVSYKHKDGNAWVINDTTAYYVLDQNQHVFQLIFNGVDSTTGAISFNKRTADAVGVTEVEATGIRMTTFPNPVAEQLHIIINATENSYAIVMVTDMTGKQMMNNTWNFNAGLNTATIPTQNLAAGMWLVTIRTSTGSLTSKFIKTN